MKKIMILILLLFIVACSRLIENPEIKSNKIIIVKNNQKEVQKTTIYDKEENEETINNKQLVINSNKETIVDMKGLQRKITIKNKKDVKPNSDTSIKKEESKVKDKKETFPPVVLPNEDVAPIPDPMPENPPEVKPDPPVDEVFLEKIYIGGIGNSGMEFTSWDEAGNFAEEQVHDKNSKYYHYSWARTTIVYYKYDSKANVVPNSRRETYTIDFWE